MSDERPDLDWVEETVWFEEMKNTVKVEHWEVVESSDTLNIKCGKRGIARVQKKVGAEADAHLIAAAPELLEACELAASGWFAENSSEVDSKNKIRAAIAKAKQLTPRWTPGRAKPMEQADATDPD